MPLRTARLVLRAAGPADAAALADGVGHLSVARWLGSVPYPYGIEDAAGFIEETASSPCHWLVLHSDSLIGGVSLDGQLGYWLRRDMWGQGFGTEMLRPVLDLHFTCCHDDVVAWVQDGNDRSLRLLRRLGFRRTGDGLREAAALGQPVASGRMALTRSVWLENQTALR
ncbi:GNAT family acetyltransferase [Oceaniovalibus guishaninsula JLT2003]|uniref:GNAT family acetyltransferase n=1 Tax=Oceaniovalibus guishaninsula JLT2003 TaxID=1231392 RepID=K2HE38_9RHOB|nr:GNAT family N-acetyltransferase [Oceaniovalibus guishaninsula]EKE45728.1 GNAT family acetyltransferase [Oceaniovalibus guishaninsula JLT2003]